MRGRAWGIPALIVVLLSAAPVMAKEQKTKEEQPSLELLEFLGEWQTKDGVWFDPTQKEQKQVSTQEQSHEQTRKRK